MHERMACWRAFPTLLPSLAAHCEQFACNGCERLKRKTDIEPKNTSFLVITLLRRIPSSLLIRANGEWRTMSVSVRGRQAAKWLCNICVCVILKKLRDVRLIHQIEARKNACRRFARFGWLESPSHNVPWQWLRVVIDCNRTLDRERLVVYIFIHTRKAETNAISINITTAYVSGSAEEACESPHQTM